MEKRCWIVGAGDFCARGWSPKSGDLVIAADGGQGALSRLHARADIVVGDFDSLREAPDGGEVVRLPAEKDDTDMVAALRLALARGCRDIRIYGAAGGRIDHTIANLQSLNFLARQGARGVLVEEHYSVTSILNGEIRFAAASRGMLSVFAQGGEARGVYLEGPEIPAARLHPARRLPHGREQRIYRRSRPRGGDGRPAAGGVDGGGRGGGIKL